MKVGFDISPLSGTHSNRGIGSFTQHLLSNLKKLRDIEVVEFDTNSKIGTEVDLVHYPYFDLFKRSLSLNSKFPRVVTIHDVIPLVFPEHYPAGIGGLIALYLQKLSLKNVAMIQTDSQCSKRDIGNYLGVSLKKLSVTYLAAGDEFKVITDKNKLIEVSKRYKLPERFALFVGNVNWNKNIVGLAQGAVDAGVDVVLVGSSFSLENNLNHPELASLKEFRARFNGNPLVHILGFVPTLDLVLILNQAGVFLYPSFYEGFGIPILEAQACGVPVITSSISSMSEVAGDSALMVDPYKTADIGEAIKKIMSNENLRREIVRKGFDNEEKFSWRKTAEETAKIYEELLKKPS